MRAGVIKRVRAAPAPATSDVTVIDRPNDAACGLPASRRLCVSTTCGAALTPRLQGGEEHATRCAFDSGGLVLDDSKLFGSKRRVDCLRLYACEEVWILASTNANAGASCPKECRGFVQAGSLVPVTALARAKGRL